MENVRIQDDLYTYVNQEKLESLVIPDDMPVAGGFANLSKEVEELMIGEFNAMCKEGKYPNDYLARACKLFELAKDVKRKKKHGIKPALKNLAILNKINTVYHRPTLLPHQLDHPLGHQYPHPYRVPARRSSYRSGGHQHGPHHDSGNHSRA